MYITCRESSFYTTSFPDSIVFGKVVTKNPKVSVRTIIGVKEVFFFFRGSSGTCALSFLLWWCDVWLLLNRLLNKLSSSYTLVLDMGARWGLHPWEHRGKAVDGFGEESCADYFGRKFAIAVR